MRTFFILLIVCLLVAQAADKPPVRPRPDIRPPPINRPNPNPRPNPRPIPILPPRIPGRGKRDVLSSGDIVL